MAAKKKTATRPSSPYLTDADPEDLSPSNRVAHEILTQRADLLPSVERIMSAGLEEGDAEKALTLFHESLTSPGDPNRDPRVAIASATGEPVLPA